MSGRSRKNPTYKDKVIIQAISGNFLTENIKIIPRDKKDIIIVKTVNPLKPLNSEI